MLWTENLKETIEFYTNVLGFACHSRNDEWGWATLCRDGIFIMLSLANEHTPYEKIGFTGSFYFNTDDVDAMWEMVKDKAKICYEPETFEWGRREFAIYDNNGYMLRFGQEID